MRLLVLYEELAGYFISSIVEFAKETNVEIYIIHKPTNSIAPFEFESHPLLNLFDRSLWNESETIEFAINLKPNYIFCGGWGYKPFLKICKKLKKTIPITLGFDNQWNGSLKQRMAIFYGRIFLKNIFEFAFVPGMLQKKFALKLGFKEQNIHLGAYCCDYNFFNTIFEKTIHLKKEKFPKVFLFTGRYSEEKGIRQMWDAFNSLSENNDWELWCIGKGPIEPAVHPKIKHFGFVQPKDLAPIIENAGVFILPSLFEPWGVVIHEMATAGLPILCSENVGAAELFIENQYNGYSFNPNEINEIKLCMNKIIKLSDAELIEMSLRSNSLSKKITHQTWNKSMKKMLQIN